MKAATLVVATIFALPPTWISGPLMAPELSYAFSVDPPTVSHLTEELQNAPTGIMLAKAAPQYVAYESPAEARQAALSALINRITQFKLKPLADSNELERMQIRDAFGVATRLIHAMPDRLPLPKAMLLSSQISLYWDFGRIYAELAISGDGKLSIYGKHPGREDLLLDTSFQDLLSAGLKFPSDLDEILIAA